MPAVRHLSEAGAVAALRRGKGIEQLLPFGQADGRRTIRWLTITPGRDTCRLTAHEVFELDPEFLDIGELEPVDPGEYLGEGREAGTTESPAEALEMARERFGARPDRWVNQGLVGDEYAAACEGV